MNKGDKMLDRYRMSIKLISLSSTSSSALDFFVGDIGVNVKARAAGMEHQGGRTRKKMLNGGSKSLSSRG